MDSDFDISECDQETGEQNEDDLLPKKKRKKWKTPFVPKAKKTQSSTAARTPKHRTSFEPSVDYVERTRMLRKSTLEVSEVFRQRRIEEEQRKRFAPRTQKRYRQLTQKELLKEAKRTEIENLASLDAYTRLESERKKVKAKKPAFEGPAVRFLSVSMPLITEVPEDSKQSGDPTSQQQQQLPAPSGGSSHYCRNFLVFTDTNSFPQGYFPSQKPAKPKRVLCPITGLPAKYVDPLTNTPYATPQAFKIIRNRYVNEEEQKCQKRLLQLSSWLEEKKRKKMKSQ